MKRMMTLSLIAAGLGLAASGAQAENFAESRSFEQGYVRDEGAYQRSMPQGQRSEQLAGVDALAIEERANATRLNPPNDRDNDGVIDFFYDEGRSIEAIPQ